MGHDRHPAWVSPLLGAQAPAWAPARRHIIRICSLKTPLFRLNRAVVRFSDGVKMDLECCGHHKARWAFIPSGAHHKCWFLSQHWLLASFLLPCQREGWLSLCGSFVPSRNLVFPKLSMRDSLAQGRQFGSLLEGSVPNPAWRKGFP